MSEEINAASVETSNAPVDHGQVADSVEQTEQVNDSPVEVEAGKPSLKERLQQAADKKDEEKGRKSEEEHQGPAQEQAKATDQDAKPDLQVDPPKFEPNWKYKAFGKEKELDEFWRPLVKDAESEKRVKEIFTRADAFDDMKQRYEASSQNGQQTLMKFNDLERDVKRVTGFLNKGDLDNFFQSVGISDDRILGYLQQKADISKMGPEQQMQYNRSVQERAQNVYNQEQYSEMNQMMAQQRSELRRMQLDHALVRPEVSSVASAFDQKMGQGQFRQLVIDEAIKAHQSTGQDLSGDEAVQNVLNRWGKMFEQASPQVMAQPQVQNISTQPQAPQAPKVVDVRGKAVIPNVQGRGTSPVKQAPKSLADLRKIGAAERHANAQYQEANF